VDIAAENSVYTFSPLLLQVCSKHRGLQRPAAMQQMLLLQDWEDMPELAPWMQRMRVSRAQGSMSLERQQVLQPTLIVSHLQSATGPCAAVVKRPLTLM
jgi:hypothetical protein